MDKPSIAEQLGALNELKQHLRGCHRCQSFEDCPEADELEELCRLLDVEPYDFDSYLSLRDEIYGTVL